MDFQAPSPLFAVSLLGRAPVFASPLQELSPPLRGCERRCDSLFRPFPLTFSGRLRTSASVGSSPRASDHRAPATPEPGRRRAAAARRGRLSPVRTSPGLLPRDVPSTPGGGSFSPELPPWFLGVLPPSLGAGGLAILGRMGSKSFCSSVRKLVFSPLGGFILSS